MKCQTTRFRPLVYALAFLALGGSSIQASTIIGYTTSGFIDTTGVSGTSVISYLPVSGGMFDSPSGFSLGQFQVAPLGAGQSTTYTNTPFQISLLADTLNGTAPVPNETPVIISGVLNGILTATNQSNVVATFNPVINPKFQTGDWSNIITVMNGTLALVPSSTNDGHTSAQAHLDSTYTGSIPEPTTIAMFLSTLVGLGIRQRLRSHRSV